MIIRIAETIPVVESASDRSDRRLPLFSQFSHERINRLSGERQAE